MAILSTNASAQPNVFHKILGKYWTMGLASKDASWKGYLDETSTDKRYFDDVGRSDPDLWRETEEGATIQLDQFAEDVVTRYRPKKFAQRLVMGREFMEDCQYEQAYDATKMMGTSCILTQNYYGATILDNAAVATAVWGDNVCLGNVAHPTRLGTTISNILAIPLAITNTAIQTMLVQAEKMPGTNGRIFGVRGKRVFGPSDLKFRAKEILKSALRDDVANNAINALKGELSADYHSVPEMASTTNWFMKTDVDRGGLWVWRVKPDFQTFSDPRDQTESTMGYARWVAGSSNFRWILCSFA